MKTFTSTLQHLLCAALLFAAACEKPGVAPGLDQLACDGGPCPAPGVIQGSVVYSGTTRGDAVLLLFDTAALPPPDGNGTSAAAVARVPQAALFGSAPSTSIGPFSAQFTFSQVPSGRSYQIRAFIDATHDFDPFFDFARQPRAGDPVGGHGEIGPDGQPRLVAIDVAPGQAVSGVSVALTQTLPYDPPSFELADGSQVLSASMDRPARLRLRIASLTARSAAFPKATFALELDRDAQGQRQSSFGDGLDDVFPRVILRQLSGLDAQGKPSPVDPSAAAIVPCRVVSTPVLPALVNMAAGALPLPQDRLDVLVQPFAVGPDLVPLAAIPAGAYQVVVIEKSGQVWTLPNQLGDPALGAAYFAPSQAESVTFAPDAALPPGSIAGDVVWQGDTTTRSGNIVVQAYLDDPFNPPPPVGAALPVRVQAIPAAAVQRTTQGLQGLVRADGIAGGQLRRAGARRRGRELLAAGDPADAHPRRSGRRGPRPQLQPARLHRGERGGDRQGRHPGAAGAARSSRLRDRPRDACADARRPGDAGPLRPARKAAGVSCRPGRRAALRRAARARLGRSAGGRRPRRAARRLAARVPGAARSRRPLGADAVRLSRPASHGDGGDSCSGGSHALPSRAAAADAHRRASRSSPTS